MITILFFGVFVQAQSLGDIGSECVCPKGYSNDQCKVYEVSNCQRDGGDQSEVPFSSGNSGVQNQEAADLEVEVPRIPAQLFDLEGNEAPKKPVRKAPRMRVLNGQSKVGD